MKKTNRAVESFLRQSKSRSFSFKTKSSVQKDLIGCQKNITGIVSKGSLYLRRVAKLTERQ
ncbi:hypothetical protein LEP1GSC193_3805 [Leptospira alstonii serovar Pingchang str. 80-412]|uniref:Uncharacterized protein n=2 Tax=Leptospira alstonii TaxID=28452 RepID=M6CVI0_9LEPT|nr:hypothetical protein LEP1GSC194_3096 [Leptospira alstonii serovar Sichuan str. 79601]EQA80714.1 hypothetical protein LEP1GSC193_3805 [Leptospira alstonii serovar Pingchang str. 80-412]